MCVRVCVCVHKSMKTRRPATLEGLRERLRWRLLLFAFLGDFLVGLFGGERERPLEELLERVLERRRPFDEEPLERPRVLLSESL